MGRFLNVGIIQMPLSEDTRENLSYIAKKVDDVMGGYHRPELVVGVEGGIGFDTPQPIPGPITDFLAKIAQKHEIYFIPGTMWESHAELESGMFYNSAPVFNPKGELIAVYRKMAPWRPFESESAPGKEYVVFDIPEKETKIGVQICYDLNFPEISRNETLMGAEVLIKLTEDPEELCIFNKMYHYVRALENQAYLVSTNGVRSGDKSEFDWNQCQHTYMTKYDFTGLEDYIDSLKDKPLYLTLDLDVLDPSVLPGTGTPEPGGVGFETLRRAITAICQNCHVVACDVNELSPGYDPSGASTLAAAKIVREMLLAIG